MPLLSESKLCRINNLGQAFKVQPADLFCLAEFSQMWYVESRHKRQHNSHPGKLRYTEMHVIGEEQSR